MLRDAAQVSLSPFEPSPQEGTWSFQEVRGRLVQVSGEAVLTAATELVAQAQAAGEPVAWVAVDSDVYPPDLAACGVDLDSLVVVRVHDAQAAARAADRLVRSGGFGMVVVDLTADGDVPLAVQSRLVGLAQRQEAAVVCLTRTPPEAPSLSPLVSLRVHVRRDRKAPGVFACVLRPVRDKRRGTGWVWRRDCVGPAGVR
jgi:recombination protein RecA